MNTKNHLFLKVLYQIILPFLLFLGFLAIGKPLREWLDAQFFTLVQARMVASIIIRPIMLVGIILLIWKTDLGRFVGWQQPMHLKNFQATLIFLFIVSMGITSNLSTYQDTSVDLLILFILSVLSVGFLEEFFFRGYLLPRFLQLFPKTRFGLLSGVVLSALLFGMVHYINLFRQPDNFWGITSQVFFAFSIGIFFAGLLFRTENIFLISLLHTLINFSFGAGELQEASNQVVSDQSNTTSDWTSILPTMLFFLFITGGGIFSLLVSNWKEMLNQLPKKD